MRRAAYEALSDVLTSLSEEVPIYVASRQLISALAGFDIHRGCLAAGRRRATSDLDGLIARASASAPRTGTRTAVRPAGRDRAA